MFAEWACSDGHRMWQVSAAIGGWGGQEMSAIVVDGDHTKHTTAIEIMGAHKLEMYDVNGWSPSHVAGVKEK